MKLNGNAGIGIRDEMEPNGNVRYDSPNPSIPEVDVGEMACRPLDDCAENQPGQGKPYPYAAYLSAWLIKSLV